MFLAYDPTTNPLNNNEWSFPLTECFHIGSFAMSVGTIAITDFRLLGIAMRKQTAAQLMKDMSLWTLAGLIIVITSGLVLFSTDPLGYYNNPAFRYKCMALLVAILFNYTIHRKVAMSGSSSAGAKLTAAISLFLWVSIVFAGLFYAFV